MKIFLSVPMNRPSDTEFSLNDSGLGYVAAASKLVGAEVSMNYWNKNYDYDSFKEELLNQKPDIIGIKVFTTFFNQVHKMLTISKEVLPDSN